MSFLQNLRDRRQEDAAKRLENKAIELYQQYAGRGDDPEGQMYDALYDDLRNRAGLDIATVISLIQIALYIWQWFRTKGVQPEQAVMAHVPAFDFKDDHEEALGKYGSFLGLAG